METICDLIEDLRNYGSVKGNVGILYRLDKIQCKAEKMEDRLLKYCNAIEDLGFSRINRNYEGQ